MRKAFRYYLICWLVLLAVFHGIVFATPNEIAGLHKFSGAFWIGYAMIVLSMVGQLGCAYAAFAQENASRFFYHLPLITVSYAATIASVLLGTACMAIPSLPEWVGVAACVLLLGFSTVAVVQAKAAADIVADAQQGVQVRTQFTGALMARARTLCHTAKQEAVRAQAKQIYTALRYSDPVSGEALRDVEQRLAAQFDAFERAVMQDDAVSSAGTALQVLSLIRERNEQCRLLK
jgi:hypothetical protein